MKSKRRQPAKVTHVESPHIPLILQQESSILLLGMEAAIVILV